MICERISIQTENSAKDTHLDTYILEDFLDGGPKWKRPLVLICPGGAYARTSNREAEPIALQMTAMGYHAAVLRYSCVPAVYPTALHEVALSVKYLRDRAQQWHIDTDKILVMGFSAGGHLAASYGVFWQEEHMAEAAGCSQEELRPQGLILCYPVISSDEKIAHTESIRNLLGDSYEKLKEKMSLENQVTAQVPKTFLWHTFADETVPFWNSFRFVQALGEKGIPVEYHLYPEGKHGLSLATESVSDREKSTVEEGCQSWMPLLQSWLMRNFGLSGKKPCNG